MEKRVWLSLLTLVVVVGFLVSIALLFSRTGMTGFATYSEGSQSDFDLGTYENTSYNGSAVVLSGSNLTGTYTSKIFDATNDATWNSLSWTGNTRDSSSIFLTSALHLGINRGEVFNLDGVYYLADMKDSSKNFYLNFSDSLIDGTILKIYAKKNKGLAIGIYSQSDIVGSNPLGTFTVDSTTGEWYNVTLDISTPTNAIWIGEGTGSGTDPKDEFDYIYAEILSTNLSFQVRNCSSADCSDGTWQIANLVSLNLIGRYFQYKASFTSPDTSISPSLESTIINYDLINTAPTITLVAPQDGASFGTNQSLSLNFIASDADSNIDSCWYKINSGSNIIIANCANTTFNVAEGSHTLTVYVNDTEGEQANDSATFSVSVGAPTIVLNSPIDSYLNSQAVIFRYTPTDVNLASCELWGDFAGSFALNQTNANPTSGSENIFSLNLADGTYLWNIRCNDSAGNSAFNGNKTFYVDITNPALSLSQPIGTKTSRTGISLTFTITDASPTSCLYNIKWSTGESVIANTTIANCLSTTFSVAADGNYVLNLYINDSAGNTNSTNSSFSVDTSTPSTPPSTPPTGGSGGGSGGSSFPPNKSEFSMSLSDLGEVIMKPGESKSLSLEARNTGTKMQNNCKISSSGWISGSEENDLNANELAGFVFTVEVPQDAETGDYDLSVVLKCQDGEKNAILKILILEGDIGVSIKEIKEINKNKILFSYIIRELAGKNIDATLNFIIVDVDENKIAESSGSVSLSALEEKELDAEIEIPAGTSGEYELIVEVSSEGASVRDKTNVLITGTGITGFAGFLNMSETNKKYLSIAILIGVAGLLGFFIVRRIIKSMGKDASRKGVIKVNKKGDIN